MTKEQAYQQADTENLYATDQTNTDIIFRAMEIFAGAFAEWVDKKDWLSWNNEGQILWCRKYDEDTKNYTTPELISEFEKIDNK